MCVDVITDVQGSKRILNHTTQRSICRENVES